MNTGSLIFLQARELWTEGRSTELIDPLLPREEHHSDEIARCTQIGLLCIERNQDDRPTMRDVLPMLCGESGSLRAPTSTKRITSRKRLSEFIHIEAITAPLRGEPPSYVDYGSDCPNDIVSDDTTDDR